MCEIAPMPSHMEPVAPLAFYLPGTADKVGSFRVNMALHKIKRKTIEGRMLDVVR